MRKYHATKEGTIKYREFDNKKFLMIKIKRRREMIVRVELRYIQELSCHKNNKITEIYTRVTTKSVGKIKSLLDSLSIKEGGANRWNWLKNEDFCRFSQSWNKGNSSDTTLKWTKSEILRL